jgi:hypothetical protein
MPVHWQGIIQRGCKERELMQIAIGSYMTETSTPVSRLPTCLPADACPRPGGENHKSGLGESLKVGSIALTVALIEAQSLRSHTLYLLIKCVNFLIKPRVLRSRRIAAAQLFERFLNGQFGCFSHGNNPTTQRATSNLGKNLQPSIVPWDNSGVRVSRIQFDCECVRPTQRIALS